MNKPKIVIRPRGRMANQMFQLMLAVELSRKLGGAPIYGYHLPEWGIIGPKLPRLSWPDEMFLISKHKFNAKNLSSMIEQGIVGGVLIEGWGMRLNYFGAPQRYQRLFQTEQKTPALSDRELLINIRAEDIADGFHPKYFPMAFSYFDNVIASTKLEPVFMGQIGDDAYSQALRSRFKGARFLPRLSPITDFQTIRKAHHIALSISSFSWLAGWLSEHAQSIHMPIAGLFNPTSSGQNLVPISDTRYKFYKVPFPSMVERENIDLVKWAEESGPVYEISFRKK